VLFFADLIFKKADVDMDLSLSLAVTVIL